MTATTQGLTRTVCEYVAASRYDDLPADVVEVAKRLTLDSLGTTLAGGTLGDGGPETAAVVLSSGGNPREHGARLRQEGICGDGGPCQRRDGACAELRRDRRRGRTPRGFALTAPLAIAERRGG